MKKIGRYDILEELGRGATGVVYKASDPTIGRVVALKVLSLNPSTAEGVPGAREIFMREARAAGRLSHPGIVTIHDALEDAETQSSCIVMEFVPGQTLERVLAAGPRFETKRALEIARQVAEALDYAHGQNVIHRDLKPANIILTDAGQVKLMDFGIAKIMAREGAHRTLSIMGTPSYMSPEQVSGRAVDARSDLFSLGTILYLMLTEQKPFKGDTAAVLFKIVYEDPVLPSQLNPELTQAHDYIVLRCLAKNRAKRYSSAQEFLDDLEDIQQGRFPRSEAKIPLAELRTGEPTQVVGEVSPASLAPGVTRKMAWISVSLGAGLVFLISLLALWTSRQRNLSTPAPLAAQATSSSSAPPASAQPTSPAVAAQGLKSNAPLNQGAAPGAKVTAPAQTGSEPKTLSAPSRPAGSRRPSPAGSGRVIQLICRYDLASATLTVSGGNRVISQWSLKGKKTRRFLGLKRGVRGTRTEPITIPADTRVLSVRVVSADGSFDHSTPVSATPPAGAPAALQVEVGSSRLTVNWQVPPHPKT
jgi:serine/threonine-protein kinase